MTRTSVYEQFIGIHQEYKEYFDFMDILDSSEKTLINKSKYVLKPFDAIFYGKVFPGNIFTDPNFEISEHVTYFQQLFNTFLEWAEKDYFLRENGEGEYDYEEIDRWDGLFKRLNRLPTKGKRIIFDIIEVIDRKQCDNYVKQITNKLEEKKTKTEKLNLLHKLKMSERYNHYETLIEWIDDTLYLIKNDRYEDATTDIKGHLDLTEIQLLLELLSDEGLFPKIFNPSESTPVSKRRLFLSQLFNKPTSSFKNPEQNAQKIQRADLDIGQFVPRIKNLTNIKNMLDGISYAKGIENVIKKINKLIYELKEEKKRKIKQNKNTL